ncbi:uncharacterized protein N7459_002539 [Penicillium hispanicum]|uniref:uncharacterized protein n=1 Tax=Penicillium hispanicum TaxID=1080232 RepID=UPI00253FF52D|nr:uncharacterized protein N7459_002539 [Penicillium hispanicum]KAJ5586774.1 hypothetical protein N7459_002539 [Penicillium hispanicum]
MAEQSGSVGPRQTLGPHLRLAIRPQPALFFLFTPQATIKVDDLPRPNTPFFPGGVIHKKSPMMDVFGALPWFLLRDILCRLPDLPTLHRLSQASPAVAKFLHHTNGVYTDIVEQIITHTDGQQGLNQKVQFYLRTLVLIWWRASADDERNPLPTSFEDVVYFIGKSSPEGRPLPTGFGDNRLPRSTPPAALDRLLDLYSRVRQMAHACFHEWIARCMRLMPERLKDPGATFSRTRYHPRPQGVPLTPVDIGPPSWLEEQRLIRAFLRYYLFWELKEAVMTNVLPISPDNLDLHLLEKNEIQSFWCEAISTKIVRLRAHQGTQFQAVLAWIEKRQLAGSSTIPPEFLYCCPTLTPLSPEQLLLTEDPHMQRIPGPVWLKKLDCSRSPLRNVDHAIFQRLGFEFWDEERMIALGFVVPGSRRGMVSNRHQDEYDLWFRWSSILTEEQYLSCIGQAD